MENHPIPQDITGFQFKLIGEMTIRQFAYIASFIIVGWVIYSFPIYSFIRIPLAFIIGSFGFALAFVPISGRPMDVMISNFIRALFNPTQFVYVKNGGMLYAQTQNSKVKIQKSKIEEPEPEEKKSSFAKASEDKKEMVYFSSLANYQNASPSSGPQAAPVPNQPHAFDYTKAPQVSPLQAEKPKKEEDKKEMEILEREKKLEQELLIAKQNEARLLDPALTKKAHEETLALSEELRQVLGEKDKLERQLQELNRKLEQSKKTFYTPSASLQPAPETKRVRVVAQGQGARVGLPIAPDSPNVISGIIKDPRGNPLSNILVEVKDQSGNPVRAFKTNGVGQFASATALTNGVYTIEFEDPKEENKFDAIQFEAKGEIILPIEVISVDKREELRRELFN